MATEAPTKAERRTFSMSPPVYQAITDLTLKLSRERNEMQSASQILCEAVIAFAHEHGIELIVE